MVAILVGWVGVAARVAALAVEDARNPGSDRTCDGLGQVTIAS